jgi:hypothetical protein
MPSLGELYAHLEEDTFRAGHPFSDDMETANAVLLNPFAKDPQRRISLECWFQRWQPCLFGRMAGKRKGIHYCFLTVEDLLKSDAFVRDKVTTSRKLWKHRALRGDPRHGFILSECDRKVAYAAPGEAFLRFALKLQEVVGWPARPESRENDIVDEWLYLRHPGTGAIQKFTFSVDFFASAGHDRWWHDHRVPGGLVFTANSLGHMVCQQEWYEGKKNQIEWALRTAMLTIDTAEKAVPHGPATYLLGERVGRPLRSFTWSEDVPLPAQERLGGKDCGSYGGHLHTDHAVRQEFFHPQVEPRWLDEPYLMDFTYIFDTASADHVPFMIGETVDEASVLAEIGHPDDLRTIAAAPGSTAAGPPAYQVQRIEDALARCRTWELTDEEEKALL